MDRTRAWLAVSPLVGAGVLAAHALAYRLTGTPSGSFHAYLDHAPQVLVVLAVVGLCLAAFGTRLRSPAPWIFPVAALGSFAVQEHLERLLHGGDVTAVATSRVFLVGLLLQAPVALAAWLLARRLLPALEILPARRAALPRLSFELAPPPRVAPALVPLRRTSGRGPPPLLRR